MAKPRTYIETSVIGYLTAKPSRLKPLPLLDLNEDALKLADRFVRRKVLPVKAGDDALPAGKNRRPRGGVSGAGQMNKLKENPMQQALWCSLILTVAAADDVREIGSGGGLNARIIFLAPATGVYQIIASSVDGAGIGTFTLAVKTDDARQAEALEARVRFLKSAGKTAEALAAARELVKARARSHGPTHWQTVDARWQVRILERIASLGDPR